MVIRSHLSSAGPSVRIAIAVCFFVLSQKNALSSEQPRPAFERRFEWTSFYRGNTHTHSNRSDGDSPAEAAIAWYRDHGYHFVVLTDHNRASVQGEFDDLDVPGEFVHIAGEELTYNARRKHAGDEKPRWYPVHVNSLCSTGTQGGGDVEIVRDAIQTAVDRVRSQPGAVAQINHPNFHYALSLEDILPAQGAALLEVANQHSGVTNEGNGHTPSTEALWDRLLSAGKRIWGVADDDVHDITRTEEELGYPVRRPGLGWVQVAAPELTPAAICAALEAGDFYFSTGIELDRIQVSARELVVEVMNHSMTTVSFIGKDGRVLSRQEGSRGRYRLRGDETYVRAVIEDGQGRKAWTQPLFVQP